MSSATHRFNLATSIPNTNINFSLAQLGECNMLRDSKSKSIAYIGRTAMESIRGVNVEGDGTGTDTITPILFPHIVVTGLLALVAAAANATFAGQIRSHANQPKIDLLSSSKASSSSSCPWIGDDLAKAVAGTDNDKEQTPTME
eukprot:CAMPEP_0201965262 /NCGR_PEP_ID=MMETSP0904-20121228/10610_1 /ASSEMBLY_ACC=CAM_ASM_000553 /TAXON_ID=420261 /ORGANISM="Thalassiosira antarctica, Strain CCMP982" /LENGTH=143 /DNA_ID=CAMNT_0048512283 /DNA_START=236 /DNA_END=663 /DNA_ORIENTATION=+